MVAAASSISRLRVPPCENSARRDLDTRAPWRAGERERAVGRAGVDHQQLDLAGRPPAPDGGEHLAEKRAAVEHGQRDGHVAAPSRTYDGGVALDTATSGRLDRQ